ncbi:MAG TPA: UPF0182 family protein, partial [Vicinamibacteria bacterium]
MFRRRLPVSPGVLALLLALLLIFALPGLVRFYIDWLWFGEVGYQQVFLRTLTAKAALSTAVFAL